MNGPLESKSSVLFPALLSCSLTPSHKRSRLKNWLMAMAVKEMLSIARGDIGSGPGGGGARG